MARRRHVTINATAVNQALNNAELVADMFGNSRHMYLEDECVKLFISYPYGHVWILINYGGDGISVEYRKTEAEYENSKDNHVYKTVKYDTAKELYTALVHYFSDKKNAARV